jgi:hypothetical protein
MLCKKADHIKRGIERPENASIQRKRDFTKNDHERFHN